MKINEKSSSKMHLGKVHYLCTDSMYNSRLLTLCWNQTKKEPTKWMI